MMIAVSHVVATGEVMGVEAAVHKMSRVLRRIALNSFPFKIRLEAAPPADPMMRHCISVRVSLSVDQRPNDDSIPMFPGDTLSVHFNRDVPVHNIEVSDDLTLVRLVRRHIQDAVLHELDEHLLVDGLRAFDPHKETLSGR